MKTPTEQIGSAINTYYEGLSLNAVRRNLQQTYNNYPSDSTVYEWVSRYTKEAIKEADKIHPQVGGQWVVDETVVHKNWGGRKRRLWLIDVLVDPCRRGVTKIEGGIIGHTVLLAYQPVFDFYPCNSGTSLGL